MVETMPPDTRHLRTEKLSQLRQRFGNAVVDALLRVHGGLAAAHLPNLDADITALLAWESDVPAEFPGEAQVEPLRERQLLSNQLPNALGKLSADMVQGGSTHDDPMLAALLVQGAHLYPSLLLQTERCFTRYAAPSPLLGRMLSQARRADELLRAEGLFPPKRPRSDAARGVSTFSKYYDVGGLFEPAELVLHAAWELCLLRGAWTAHDYGEAIVENLARIRRVHTERVSEAPLFLGFSGPRLTDGFQLGGCRVRPYVGGLQSAPLGKSERLELHDASGFIMEVSRPWRYTFGDVGKGEPALSNEMDWLSLARLAESVAVGHVVGRVPQQLLPHQVDAPDAFPPLPILRWVFPADPIHHTRTHHFATDWPFPLGRDDEPYTTASLQHGLKLFEVQDRSFQIAVRRIVDAGKFGRRWGDSLLDAVIAWEAMSGDCKGDVASRVCSVVAHLVSAPGHRRNMSGVLKRIYGVRSRVVHAGEVPTTSKERDGAILVAAVALRQLAGPHAPLLDHRDRFSTLCLHE